MDLCTRQRHRQMDHSLVQGEHSPQRPSQRNGFQKADLLIYPAMRLSVRRSAAPRRERTRLGRRQCRPVSATFHVILRWA